MSKFVNPVPNIAPRATTITIEGKDVPFTELGLDEIGAIVEQFPAMRPMMTGDEDVDMSQFTPEDNNELAILVIAMAVAPGLEDGPDKDALMGSIRNMRRLERDVAMGTIMQASFPETEAAQADAGNVKKPAAKKAAGGARKTKRAQTTRKTGKPAKK